MALEITTTNVLIGIGIAITANIVYGISGWLKNNEAFEIKKFLGTIITAVVVGAVAGIAVVGEIEAAATQTQLLIIYVGLFTAPIVVDVFRTNISGAVATRNEPTEPTQ